MSLEIFKSCQVHYERPILFATNKALQEIAELEKESKSKSPRTVEELLPSPELPVPPTQRVSRRTSIFKSKRRPSKTTRTTGRTQRQQTFMTRRRLDTIPEITPTPSDRMKVI